MKALVVTLIVYAIAVPWALLEVVKEEGAGIAVLQRAQGRFAVAMSVALAGAFVVLLWTLPAAGRASLLAYAVSVGFLWWMTSGEHPWVWPYAGRREASLRARLLYSVLQLNRALGIAAIMAVVAACALALLAVVATAVVASFDFVLNGRVHLSAYSEFYLHDLPAWIGQAAGGHAGSANG